MRRQVIPDHLAVLHHKADAFDLRNVSDRISGHGNDVGKFSRLNGTFPCWSRSVAELGQSSLAFTFGRGAQLRVVLPGRKPHGWHRRQRPDRRIGHIPSC
jgi:hypothetical protein